MDNKQEVLCLFLLGRGYEEYSGQREHQEAGVRSFSKRLPAGSPCATNDHKISWHATVWPALPGFPASRPGVELELFGEQQGGVWFALKAYSISAGEVGEKLAEAEETLRRMWVLAYNRGNGPSED